MKKFRILSLAAIAVMMMTFVSCLDSGNNTSTGTVYGVVDYNDSFKKVVYGLDGGVYYVPTIVSDESLQSGDCVGVYGTIDYGSADNANASTTGYYVMNASEYEKYTSYYATGFMPSDTSTIQTGELPIMATSSLGSGTYIKGHLFVALQFASVKSDQKNSYSLSYDMDNVSNESGTRVYNLYVRAKKVEDGSKSASTAYITVPFEMSNFFTQATAVEKGLGNTAINVRINYISALNSDSTQATWTKSDVYSYTIASK
jgi:hypothetical protein